MTPEYLQELFDKYTRINRRIETMYNEGYEYEHGFYILERAFHGMESIAVQLLNAFEKQLNIELITKENEEDD